MSTNHLTCTSKELATTTLKATLDSIATSYKIAEERFEAFISEFLKRNAQHLVSTACNSLKFTIFYAVTQKNTVSIYDGASHSSTFETILSFDRIVEIFKEAGCTVSISEELVGHAYVYYHFC